MKDKNKQDVTTYLEEFDERQSELLLYVFKCLNDFLVLISLANELKTDRCIRMRFRDIFIPVSTVAM